MLCPSVFEKSNHKPNPPPLPTLFFLLKVLISQIVKTFSFSSVRTIKLTKINTNSSPRQRTGLMLIGTVIITIMIWHISTSSSMMHSSMKQTFLSGLEFKWKVKTKCFNLLSLKNE